MLLSLRLLVSPAQAHIIQLADSVHALGFHPPARRHGSRQRLGPDLLNGWPPLAIEVLVPAALEGVVERNALKAMVEADRELARHRSARELLLSQPQVLRSQRRVLMLHRSGRSHEHAVGGGSRAHLGKRGMGR